MMYVFFSYISCKPFCKIGFCDTKRHTKIPWTGNRAFIIKIQQWFFVFCKMQIILVSSSFDKTQSKFSLNEILMAWRERRNSQPDIQATGLSFGGRCTTSFPNKHHQNPHLEIVKQGVTKSEPPKSPFQQVIKINAKLINNYGVHKFKQILLSKLLGI